MIRSATELARFIRDTFGIEPAPWQLAWLRRRLMEIRGSATLFRDVPRPAVQRVEDESVRAILEVRYSCFVCGVVRASVAVPARGPAEDVVHFVERAGGAAWADHERRSPACTVDKLGELLIPIEYGSRALIAR